MIHALTLAWICERGSRLRHHFQPTGWHTVPRTVLTKVMGGPVLMRKEDKHIMVYANSELIEPTPEEIAKW